jgi:beta-galactosidase
MEMRKVTLKNDPEQRLIQYADMNLAGDVDSQTYPTIEWLMQHLAGKAVRKGEQGQVTFEGQHGKYPSGKPFVMNEYCHAMGNSLGNISDYWEVIYKYDLFAGGFIWDWIDQALNKDASDIKSGFVYGGDFGDFPNNNNFCVNGIIGADLNPHPHYYEMKKVYQPVYFRLINQQPLTIEIINHNYAVNTNEYQFSYKIIQNGIVTGEKILPAVDLSPQETNTLVLDDLNFDRSAETYITLSFSLKNDCIWAEKNFVVAWEQFKLSGEKPGQTRNYVDSGGDMKLIDNNDNFSIEGVNFKAVIDKSSGLLSSLIYNNRSVISGTTRFNFWRALTDNDIGWKVDRKLGVWKVEGENYTLKNIEESRMEDGAIKIVSTYVFKTTLTTAKVEHTIFADGRIEVDAGFNIPDGTVNVPRIGLQFEISESLNKLEWYGRGPHENYFDRKTSAAIGIYKSTVNDWTTPYVRPQENGNRCDVQWINFSGYEGGIQFSAGSDNPLSVSAWPYSQDVLSKTTHDFELKKQNKIVVNIDHKQMGVGGDNSWGNPVMDKYQIKPGTYHYQFTIKQVNNVLNK